MVWSYRQWVGRAEPLPTCVETLADLLHIIRNLRSLNTGDSPETEVSRDMDTTGKRATTGFGWGLTCRPNILGFSAVFQMPRLKSASGYLMLMWSPPHRGPNEGKHQLVGLSEVVAQIMESHTLGSGCLKNMWVCIVLVPLGCFRSSLLQYWGQRHKYRSILHPTAGSVLQFQVERDHCTDEGLESWGSRGGTFKKRIYTRRWNYSPLVTMTMEGNRRRTQLNEIWPATLQTESSGIIEVSIHDSNDKENEILWEQLRMINGWRARRSRNLSLW